MATGGVRESRGVTVVSAARYSPESSLRHADTPTFFYLPVNEADSPGVLFAVRITEEERRL